MHSILQPHLGKSVFICSRLRSDSLKSAPDILKPFHRFQSFNNCKAALRPGAPMMPPQDASPIRTCRGCELVSILRPPRRRSQEEKLFERELALEDVPSLKPKSRRYREASKPAVQNEFLNVGRVLGNRIDNRVAKLFAFIVPVASFKL